MARVKGALATRKRRKRVLKLAKGYRGAKSKCFRTAKQAVMKSLVYAYTIFRIPVEVMSSINGSVIPFATPALVAAIYAGVGEILVIISKKSFLS